MLHPIFSVITVNFNSREKLSVTCDSIASQGVEHEHLILDGGSTDGSRELGERLAAKYPHVRFFSEPDEGIYHAMNKGIALASGDYIYFCGAGDLAFPHSFRQIATYLPVDSLAMVYGDVIAFGRRYDGEFSKHKLAVSNICHQSAFYGRKVYERLGVFNQAYRTFADWEMNIRCFADPLVHKIYAPVLVGAFEAGGLSTSGDVAFSRDRLGLIRRHFGIYPYVRARCTEIVTRVHGKLGRMLASGAA